MTCAPSTRPFPSARLPAPSALPRAFVRIALPSAFLAIIAAAGMATGSGGPGAETVTNDRLAQLEQRIDERIDRLDDRLWVALGGASLVGLAAGGALSLKRERGR